MARIRKSKTNSKYFLDVPPAGEPRNPEKGKKWKKLQLTEEEFFSHQK